MEQRRPALKSDNSPGRFPHLDKAVLIPKVTEDGEDRIRPDVMAFLMQAAQASHLARLRDLETSKIPTGQYAFGQTITELTALLLPQPIISFSVINDGPDSVYVEFNGRTPSRFAPVLVNETFNFNAVYPVIKSLVLDVVSGASAAVRIRAKVGRPMA